MPAMKRPDPTAILIPFVYFIAGATNLAGIATTFYYKEDLALTIVQVQILGSLSIIPWSIKPLYGFLSDRQPGPQVYVMPVGGGAVQQITAHSEGYSLDGWYPDGSALLVNAVRDHFWRAGQRFFTAVLHDHSGPGRPHLEAALRHTAASSFTAFERDVPLQRTGN